MTSRCMSSENAADERTGECFNRELTDWKALRVETPAGSETELAAVEPTKAQGRS